MTTSRVGAVIDALVATFTAGTAARVFDGPPVVSTAPATFVIVGASEDAESVVPIQQAWAGLGAHARDETSPGIPCVVVSHSGDSDDGAVKRHRDAALTLLGELESAIVADPTLGGAVAAGWLLIESGDLRQATSTEGTRAAVSFNVSYRARI